MADKPKSSVSVTINGKDVSLDQAPELVRQFLADADKNGTPDFVDQMFKNPLFKNLAGKAANRMKDRLQNIKDLTPEHQAKIKDLMEKLGDPSPPAAASASKPSPAAQIDYRSLGIPDPEQKDSPLWPILGAAVAGLIGFAVWYLMKG